ncbi:hypothetical protein [Seleniivibrio woodruffii]|uniref:Porin n=1 Tax=Seleniivibrio woodruffii TaxID=1078050 RepID=A0A4R1K592_9BACT|nr:hypothetical protein [Seleniivibrio woodruffii]TCK59346.1 hypothetical protein C8D98_2279 [Seleniivibrio woodruffii]TVZ35615.1 hypothetical protein OF66_1230 [Seleniivibrio woodruffii]
MKISRFILIAVMLCSAAAAYGFNVDGFISTSYEISKDKGEDTERLWENYLSIDNAKLYDPYFGFSFYGRFAKDSEEESDSQSDIYSAYLDYTSFQNAVEVKAGRFSYIGNRFLTLDGAIATVRTDYKFGVTAFGGKPQYFDADGRHINEKFRKTGDKLYGGRIFLNGVKDTTGYVSYSKEYDSEMTYQEFAGLGLGRVFSLGGKDGIGVDANGEYDMEESNFYRGSVRVFLNKGALRVTGEATRYNVNDGSNYQDILIISNFSTGKEEKLALTVQYAVTENVSPYVSVVNTKIEQSSGDVVDGQIYKLGADFDWFKTKGVTANVEGYYYDSVTSNAKGASLALDWNLTRDFKFGFESEYLRLENYATEDNIYSVYADAEYEIWKDLKLSVYAEKNQKTRYLPENRYGVKAAYSF